MISFRDYFYKMNSVNDGSRLLSESVLVPEVAAALKDWILAGGYGVIIGGAAVGYYGKPRMTTDVDVLFLSKDDIPISVEGFKRTRPSAFTHIKTHVEIEVTTPEHLGISRVLVAEVIKTSIRKDGILIASKSGLVALKLQRLKGHDIGDILMLHSLGDIDLSKFTLSKKNLDDYAELVSKYS